MELPCGVHACFLFCMLQSDTLCTVLACPIIRTTSYRVTRGIFSDFSLLSTAITAGLPAVEACFTLESLTLPLHAFCCRVSVRSWLASRVVLSYQASSLHISPFRRTFVFDLHKSSTSICNQPSPRSPWCVRVGALSQPSACDRSMYSRVMRRL